MSPVASTIGRLLRRISGEALDDAVFGWVNAVLAAGDPGGVVLAGFGVDGKAVREPKTPMARPRTWSRSSATTAVRSPGSGPWT